MATATSIRIQEPSPASRYVALRRLLRTQMAALRDQRRSLREATPWETIAVADREERAVQELEVGLDIALLEMGFMRVREIETAVRRLEAGDYGRCGDCGGPIRASRLQARPFAIRCGTCQQAHEGHGRRPGSAARGLDAVEPRPSAWGWETKGAQP